MTGPARRRRRTWSAFGELGRMPSEYEIVTHDTNYTLRTGRTAALELNPSAPANLWFLTYRDRSPLRVPDWNGFRDPDALTYRTYVTLQDEAETLARGILEEYSEAGHDAGLAPGWLEVLAHLFTAARRPAHATQLCHSYVAQMAPSSYISNCAAFAAADMLRRTSLLAYRTRELQVSHPALGFGTADRARWETYPAWQPARRALEEALVAYDWGESFVAVNLVLRPALDAVLLGQLGEAARAQGDDLTWLLLANLEVDAARCRRWSTALADYAIAERPENAEVIDRWVERWRPRADAAARGLAQVLDEARRS
ncbi:MAG: toluene hydroxylase [Acidimicrobiia bacterium]